jgi:hypothetical protein
MEKRQNKIPKNGKRQNKIPKNGSGCSQLKKQIIIKFL